MNPSTSVDRETFLRHLHDSGLVSAERIQKVLHSIPASDRGRAIARRLVEQNLLTRFQAERLLAGRTEGFFVGQYRILDLLGRGGMGRVFKAQHQTMNRIVALKVLASSLMKTPRARELFQREVRAAAALSHPNIVTAFDANQTGDRAYLVMEFVDGPNLHDFVKSKGQMPVTQACDVIRQVALGLQYAHDLGMVHRDIKPANLLILPTTSRAHATPYLVKILDFGLARLGSNDPGPSASDSEADSITTNAQSVVGTPDYLSPEQARDVHKADPRSDIYSLGCTFYYLLTGQVPFPGGTTLEKLVRHATEAPRPIETFRADVPQPIVAILETMLAKDPTHRFQSCHQVVDMLQPFCDSGADAWVPIEALPEPTANIPLTGAYPSPAAYDSPWASLNDDITMGGTLSGSPASTMASVSGERLRSNPSPYGWYLFSFLVLVMVILGGIAIVYWLNGLTRS